MGMLASSSVAVSPGVDVAYAAVVILVIAGMWRVFTKAGRPGWAAIIPFYNVYTLLKVCDRPGWWLIWYFIPIANLIVYCVVLIDLARSFGKGTVYGVALWFLSPILVPVLGFGSSRYMGSPRR